MSTKIEWTNETWNPIIGCSKISEGCINCYAEKMAHRLSMMAYTKYYKKVVSFGTGWNNNTYFVDQQLQKPFSWKKPRKIFVCSMGDLFHESVPFEWIDQVFDVISCCQQHTFQILTKRPERAFEYYKHLGQRLKNEGLDSIPSQSNDILDWVGILPNLWIGVTCENQERANERIPILLEIPAKVHYLSCEPLLSDIRFPWFGGWMPSYNNPDNLGWDEPAEPMILGLDWVICGPETGQKARPIQKEWIENIYQQCKCANVPFFDKKDILGLNLKQFPECYQNSK